jgi:putative DNA primase/helicase
MSIIQHTSTKSSGIPHVTIPPLEDPFENLLSRLSEVTRINDHKATAICPCHADHSPSLSIERGENGGVVAFCQVCGADGEAVVKELGLPVSALFADSRPRVTATFDYCDADGALRYQVQRLEPGRGGRSKDFRQRRPDPDSAGTWINNMTDVERIPYHLPDLRKANPDKWVFIPEGEGKVDALATLGLVATCNVGGAGKWRDEYNRYLTGRKVCLLADSDEAGESHVAKVAKSLHGTAKVVRIARMPDPIHDVKDWVCGGGATASQIAALAEAATDYTPPVSNTDSEASPRSDRPIFNPGHPMPTARGFVAAKHPPHDGNLTFITIDSAVSLEWDKGCWSEITPDALNSELFKYLDGADKTKTTNDEAVRVSYCPTPMNVNAVEVALKAETYRKDVTPPCWLDGQKDNPDPNTIIPTPSGLLQLSTNESPRIISPPTPRFFNTFALPYSFHPNAPQPIKFLQFLGELWPDDLESIATLQEWFGYCLTPDTRQQKILLICGPKRSGKGTIARVLTGLIGGTNVAGPTLLGLTRNFGLQSLIGKALAIISDARMSGRADQAEVVERLLSISGEDLISIDKKFRAPITTKLTSRIMVLTNELPRLDDASGALANRFIPLVLKNSFLVQEKPGLTDELLTELPGILNWAIEGWQRLRERGRFKQPASGAAAIPEMEDLASPVGAFVRDCCEVKPGGRTSKRELFKAWERWCTEEGRDHPGTAATFGRDLKACFPGIRIVRVRQDGERAREREYEGIGLRNGEDEASKQVQATLPKDNCRIL